MFSHLSPVAPYLERPPSLSEAVVPVLLPPHYLLTPSFHTPPLPPTSRWWAASEGGWFGGFGFEVSRIRIGLLEWRGRHLVSVSSTVDAQEMPGINDPLTPTSSRRDLLPSRLSCSGGWRGQERDALGERVGMAWPQQSCRGFCGNTERLQPG